MRSHGDLCAGAERAIQGHAYRRGPAIRFTLQYLRARRIAAGPHRQSGGRIVTCGDGAHQDIFFVFCGEHARRPLLRGDARGAQSQCHEIPPALEDARCCDASSCCGTVATRGRELCSPTASRRSPMNESVKTKKELILQTAREIGAQQFTPAEIDQLRRRLMAEHGEEGKTGNDYIADVLKEAGIRVALSLPEEAEDQYEEEFEDLLHFKTLEDAEVSIMRLDELMRKFRAKGEQAAAERVLNVGRLGKRRAEMIARNHKVEPQKRAEKEEIANWFRIWLETPDVFFDWLAVRTQSPEFTTKFPPEEQEQVE